MVSEQTMDLAKLYGGDDLKYIVIGNSGNISAAAWKNLLQLLDSKGYTWIDGKKPTESGKCPQEMDRKLWVKGNKTLMFGPVSHSFNDYFVKLNDFKKIINTL